MFSNHIDDDMCTMTTFIPLGAGEEALEDHLLNLGPPFELDDEFESD